MLWSRKRSFTGSRVVITGGSTGIGFALAQQLVIKEAHVTIIARTKSRLDNAVADLRKRAKARDKDVDIRGFPADTTDASQVACMPYPYIHAAHARGSNESGTFCADCSRSEVCRRCGCACMLRRSFLPRYISAITLDAAHPLLQAQDMQLLLNANVKTLRPSTLAGRRAFSRTGCPGVRTDHEPQLLWHLACPQGIPAWYGEEGQRRGGPCQLCSSCLRYHASAQPFICCLMLSEDGRFSCMATIPVVAPLLATCTLLPQHACAAGCQTGTSEPCRAGVAGYSSYAPSKAAVRSLADTLRNEVCCHASPQFLPLADPKQHKLDVHILFPSPPVLLRQTV